MTTFNEYVDQYERLQAEYDGILDKAYERGFSRGQVDKEVSYTNESPLSGEWAGESVPELLGDLINRAETLLEEMGENDDNDAYQVACEEACNKYEAGYEAGNGR